MTRTTCPICGGSARARRTAGVIDLTTCDECGHGALVGSTSNELFESDGYASWRDEHSSWVGLFVRRYLDDLITETGGTPGSVAEAGCATGEVLGAIARRGAECWGADLSAASIAAARSRHPDVHFRVAAMPAPDRPVQAFFAFHVLEHVDDPRSMLAEARALVVDGGLLYLRVPNFGGLAARLLGAAWPGFAPGHLHYFTRRSLRLAVEGSGWRVTRVATRGHAWPWIVGARRKLARRAFEPTSEDTPPPPRRVRLLHDIEVGMAPVSWLESRLGIGNELVLFARKR